MKQLQCYWCSARAPSRPQVVLRLSAVRQAHVQRAARQDQLIRAQPARKWKDITYVNDTIDVDPFLY